MVIGKYHQQRHIICWDGVQGSLGNVQSKASANTAIGESSLISVVISTTNSRPIVFNPKLLMSKIPAAIIKDYFYITEFFFYQLYHGR